MKKNYGVLSPRLSILNFAFMLVLCSNAMAQEAAQLETVIVSGEKVPTFGVSLDKEALNDRRVATGDTAALLEGLPGVSFYTGGGISGLPVIDGLADDRLKITVDGMTITSACPNHMNPALSYANPNAIEQIKMYAGIVPVSQGGDSIGGSIAVKSAPPEFANPGEWATASGNVSAFHRSNGNVRGASTELNAASEQFAIGYEGNIIDADNYKDGKGDIVGATRYKIRNQTLKLATQSDSSLYTFNIGWQDIPLQGFPNQAMDMTYNRSLSFNAGYEGDFSWGDLELRAFRQQVRHKMDILREKNAGQMPMDTDAVDLGYSIVGVLPVGEAQTLRLGHEFHRYTLDDWWPPLSGFMAPNDFWNIRNGKRDRWAGFAEYDNKINDKLSTQLGVRVEHVRMNTDDVQGYHSAADGSYTDMMMGMTAPYSDSTYQTDADAFNARNHKRNDLNVDLTASARYEASQNATYDIGVSRKNRSPNLHERYTWANEAMMAGLMNNWFGDLNSYVGNIDLDPETAYTFKITADWHDADNSDWQVTASPFYTYVEDYINAVPNMSSNPYNMSMLPGRRSLTFANMDAVLYGVNLSARKVIGEAFGEWAVRGDLNYTKAETTGGDGLYNIMPLNGRLAIEHDTGTWFNKLEAVFVDSKDDLSAVRAEQATAGYSIFNYRTSYKLNESVRLDAGVDNIFNAQYNLPLGGLEFATGNMMTAPQTVRAMGTSFNAALSVSF